MAVLVCVLVIVVRAEVTPVADNEGIEDMEVDGAVDEIVEEGALEVIEVDGTVDDIGVEGALEDIEVEGMVDDIGGGKAVEVGGGGVVLGASHSTSAPWARLTSWKQYSALSSCLT